MSAKTVSSKAEKDASLATNFHNNDKTRTCELGNPKAH